MTPPALYRYFPNKYAVLQELGRRLVRAQDYAVFAWIESTFPNWTRGLRAWLDLRKSLYAQYQIPPSAELHATKFISGRGNPSQDPGVNMSKRTAETPPSRRWPMRRRSPRRHRN